MYENSSVSTFFPTFEKPPLFICIIQTFFKIGVKFLYTVVSFSAVQQSEWAMLLLLSHFSSVQCNLVMCNVCNVCLVTSVVCNSVQSYGLQPARLLCPWDPLGKSTGEGCHVLLQGIFPIQGLNPGLLYCRQILYHWAPREAPESDTGIHISPLFWISRKALWIRFIQVGF